MSSQHELKSPSNSVSVIGRLRGLIGQRSQAGFISEDLHKLLIEVDDAWGDQQIAEKLNQIGIKNITDFKEAFAGSWNRTSTLKDLSVEAEAAANRYKAALKGAEAAANRYKAALKGEKHWNKVKETLGLDDREWSSFDKEDKLGSLLGNRYITARSDKPRR